MNSRNLLNLGLVIVILVLALLVVYEPGKTPEPALPRLTNLQPQDVNRIRIERKTDQPILLEKQQGMWRLREPYQLAANDFRVQSLLRLLQTESHAQHDLGSRDPKTYGLAEPRSSVIFNDTLKIDFGDVEPVSKQRYVRIDEQLHLIVDTFYYQTASTATVYASHAVLPAGDIVKLQLPDMTLTLSEGQWQLQPAQPGRSADVMTEFVNRWRVAQAIELENFSGKLPAVDIRISFKDQAEPVQYSLLKSEEEISLLRHDIRMRYILTEDTLGQLTQLPAAVAEPELAPTPAAPAAD